MEDSEEHTVDPNLNPNIKPKPIKPPVLQRIRKWYRALPDKKQYFEVITAFLSIPVLITVLISNLSNLQQKNTKSTTATTPAPTSVIEKIILPAPPAGNQSVTPSATPTPTTTPTPTPNSECVKQVGVVNITYPTEGATVSDNPVCLNISRQSQNYCSIVWSYRINGGTWSDYTDSSICMYGLTPGVKNLELRVNSVVSTDTTTLTRTFTIAGTLTPTPTVASTSATLGN